MKSNKELIRIKTKYDTKEECMENCRDHIGMTRYDWMILKKISGEVYTDGSFDLSAMARAGACQIFKGQITEEEDGIYMEGKISPKLFVKRLLLVCTALTVIVAPVYIYNWRVWGGIYIGSIFTIIAWIYFLMYFSESLEKQVIRKVT